MATWGVRPFENEDALDMVPAIARGSMKNLRRRVDKVLDRVLSNNSPLVTGVCVITAMIELFLETITHEPY